MSPHIEQALNTHYHMSGMGPVTKLLITLHCADILVLLKIFKEEF